MVSNLLLIGIGGLAVLAMIVAAIVFVVKKNG